MSILTEDAKRLVRTQRLGFVATVNPDGTPALSHKGTLTVWEEGLIFANIRSPRAVANIERGSVIEVEVVDPIVRKGYRFRGTGTVLREGELHDEIVAFYGAEFDLAASRIHGVVLITVDEAREILSPAYDQGRSEADVVKEWRRRQASLGP